jgi:thymidine kinase
MTDEGYLELFVGPMYAGKTTKLQELYSFYSHDNIPVKVINYIDDNRYNTTDLLSSHDNVTVPCTKCKCLNDAYPILKDGYNLKDINYGEFMNTHIFLINEGQFFEDIVDWIICAVNPPYNKKIYVCGLDGDFERKPFGKWLDIIPYCDKITKLTSMCSICNLNKAIFSHRLTNEKEQIVIGSTNYIPLCRGCFNKKILL